MREMVAEDEIPEWRTSIRGSVSCPVVHPAEPGCLSEQSSSASRCSVQGAAPLAMLRIYPCITVCLSAGHLSWFSIISSRSAGQHCADGI